MLTPFGKIPKVFVDITVIFTKFLSILACLYFFICSLSFLSTSFRILGGREIGTLFSNSEVLSNPLVGAMIGVLVTVLVQSSSTSSSILVGLVSAGLEVRVAIPMILGANIGTSVTNTIVSITQVGDREQFRRAFACATVHDMFNWLSVILLLIVECSTHYLEIVTKAMVSRIDFTANVTNPDFLKVLTNPLTKSIIQLDKKVLDGWARNLTEYNNVSSILKADCKGNINHTCNYLFAHIGPQGYNIGDIYIGIILLIISLVLLCSCLIGLVKILNSILGSKVTNIIKTVINSDIPNKYLAWTTGYLAMAIGAIMTILVQSSSVFTSTLTPLAGTGLVTLERVYPLCLGSNIGTTTTSLLASLAADSAYKEQAVQIALVHLVFNITGILVFYPIPWMRWPISLARILGDTTATYRWFAVFYLVAMFFFFPAFIFCISLAGPIALYSVLIPLFILVVFIVIVNLLQSSHPKMLPVPLRTWLFLPLFLRSLEPVDGIIQKMFFCFKSETCQAPKDVTDRDADIDIVMVTYGEENAKDLDRITDDSEKLCEVVVDERDV